MGKRLKVLLSAYACEPGKGSEPEVGWQWALQLARFHDVTVLTRANNKPLISAALRELPAEAALRFIYHDLTAPWLSAKKHLRLNAWYYGQWQRSAREAISRLLAKEPFDLLHHVTYAGFRHEPAVFGHGVPCIWGPVGGMEAVPWGLLPWTRPMDLAPELARNASNAWQSRSGGLARKARAATIVLASTRETQAGLAAAGVPAQLFPTIGLHLREFPECTKTPHSPLRLLYAGNLFSLKGLDLALEALALSTCEATFTLIGEGPMLGPLRRLARALDVERRVEFRGRIPRADMLRAYIDYDVLLFPSLHDSGGFAVLEAMANACPVICLDCGGPGVAVTSECGTKVPLCTRNDVIKGLAAAITNYARAPESLIRHGRGARTRVAVEYAWEKKGEAMDAIYREVFVP